MNSNRNITKMIVASLIVCPLIIASGCTGKNKLTRDKAAEMIANNIPQHIYVGTIRGFIYDIGGERFYSVDNGGDLRFGTIEAKILKERGLINYEEKPFGFGIVSGMGIANLQFTEEGRKYLVGHQEDKEFWIRLAAERKFLGVTGIKFDASEKAAIVLYQWQYDKVTPFAQVMFVDPDLIRQIHTGHATFALYDDGWRLETIQEE